jgi:hypothetical protein
MNDRIYRCSDGHLYSASVAKSILLSVHLGVATHYQRCPVDRRWRKADLVNPNTLSADQLAEAGQTRF